MLDIAVKLWKILNMSRVLLLIVFLICSAPAFASRPGGGDEGPDQCTVMGQVTRIDDDKAVIRLKETSASTTYEGCSVTGAQGMAEKNTAVTV